MKNPINMSTIVGTLVLVAPEDVAGHEITEALDQAKTVHAGPVVVLPAKWQAMSADAIRAKLTEAETQSIGASKPPPPPPPPG